MEFIVPVIKYVPPSKYDAAPYATIYKVVNDNNLYTLYIQTALEEEPHWVKLSDFLESALEPLLTDKTFIYAMLHLYAQKGTASERDFLYGLGAVIQNHADVDKKL